MSGTKYVFGRLFRFQVLRQMPEKTKLAAFFYLHNLKVLVGWAIWNSNDSAEKTQLKVKT